ncbi:MAG: guanylate kinase [Lachnospiraceae bacterium]|nr:guanylate kinase [Lachnospiraceae bacterium]
MKRKGVLVVVSGFSGVGKGTIMRRLIEKYEGYALSISATTRAPRDGETDGKEYFFHTREEFRQMISRDELVEYACYCDNYYGTPRNYVEEQMARGKDIILEIEIQGALKIKAKYPDALLLFVMPPSGDALRQRLTDRGTESAEVIEARLERAKAEADGIESYDYILVNDNLEDCVDRMHELIRCQHWQVGNNEEFIDKVRTEIKGF